MVGANLTWRDLLESSKGYSEADRSLEEASADNEQHESEFGRRPAATDPG